MSERMSRTDWQALVQRVQTFAQECFNILGLAGWKFGWDRARRRAGHCNYTQKYITLSVHFVYRNGWDEISDTVLHECAHAMAGYEHGHDAHWQEICKQIGCKPNRCYDSEEVDMPRGNWQAQCPGCQQKFYRHRRTRAKLHCRRCGQERGSLEFTWGPPKPGPAEAQKTSAQEKLAQIRANQQKTAQESGGGAA